MRDTTVTSHDGIPLAIRDHGGEEHDVVLLHGVGRTLADWSPVVDHIKDARVVSMDLRWHGRSGDTGVRNWIDFTRDVDSVVAELGLVDPFLVGHSFGGAIAAQYAATHIHCPGILNIDGFDIRQREIYEELPEAAVDAFLAEWERRGTSFVPTGQGDERWWGEQSAVTIEMDLAMGVPERVAREHAGRTFAPIGEGKWELRPPRTFWDQTVEAGPVDVLSIVAQAAAPTTVLLCKRSMPMPSGDKADFFAAGRRGLEKRLREIGSDNPLVDVQTIDASHGVIYERPADVARHIEALTSS